MSTYNKNCFGLASFRAKPIEEISDVFVSGNIRDITYIGPGVYSVSVFESMGAPYKIDFSTPPGLLPGVIAQNESAFTIGVKNLSGDWVDCGEIMSIAVHFLSEPSE